MARSARNSRRCRCRPTWLSSSSAIRTTSRLKDVYADAGILAFPTLADEWGLVVNEAMAAGLPVLGSLYGQSVEELVTEGETGWTFRPDFPDEFDSALGRALATPPAELDRMRAAARERAARVTPQSVAASICSGIEHVTGADDLRTAR